MKNVLATFLVTMSCATALACNKGDQKAAEEAQRDAEQEAREAQQAANDKIADAKADAEKAAADAAAARQDVQASVKKDVDAVDRKIAYLKERGATAKGVAQKNVAAAQGEVDTRRAAVQADVAKLQSESGSAWESAKTSFDRNLTALKDAVESLETTVTGKAAD